MNAKQLYKDWNAEYYYGIYTTKFGKPEDCIKCGKCEKVCPQHLAIRDLLESVYEQFKDSHENG